MAAVRSACRWKVKSSPPDCGGIVIRLRYGARFLGLGPGQWHDRRPASRYRRIRADAIRYAGGNGGGLPQPGVGVSMTPARMRWNPWSPVTNDLAAAG